MRKNKKAFTLVELLVAMAIIAILIGMSVFGIGIAQRVLRDNQRRAIVQDIVASLNAYYSSNGRYPTAGQVALSGQDISVAGILITDLSGPEIPCNDTTAQCTRYCYSLNNDGYYVGAELEDGNSFVELSASASRADCGAAAQDSVVIN